MFDVQLIGLVCVGKLYCLEVLWEQVIWMLVDSKSEVLVQNFVGQWLQFRDLVNLIFDCDLFFDFDELLWIVMCNEIELLFCLIVCEDYSVLMFFDVDYLFFNECLVWYYGIVGVQGDDFRWVMLNDQWWGLFVYGSILLLILNLMCILLVKCGKWILENFFDDLLLLLLLGVMELDDQVELVGVLCERMEQYCVDFNCVVCY